MFNDLADLWERLQNETIILVCFDKVLMKFQSLAVEVEWPDEISVMVGPDGPITDAERQDKNADCDISTVIRQGEVFYPDRITNAEEISEIELQASF